MSEPQCNQCWLSVQGQRCSGAGALHPSSAEAQRQLPAALTRGVPACRGTGAVLGLGAGGGQGGRQGSGNTASLPAKALRCPVFPIWVWTPVRCLMEPAVLELLGSDLSCSRVLLGSPGPDPSTSSSCLSQLLGQNVAKEQMGWGFPGRLF